MLEKLFTDSSTPLDQKDILMIAPGLFDSEPGWIDDRAVSFRYILETGHIPQDSAPQWFYDTIESIIGVDPQKKYDVDWNANDAYTNAIDQVVQRVQERIQESPTLKALLEKDQWGKHDRVEWEKEISGIVSETLDSIEGLNEARIKTESLRVNMINDIAGDIGSTNPQYELDCEILSLSEGAVLQRVEANLLPENRIDNENYKYAANYFYVVGKLSLDVSDSFGGHAFILSSATGNIIESTSDPSYGSHPYHEHIDAENHSFEKFIKSGEFVSVNGFVYASNPESTQGEIRLRHGEQRKLYTTIDPQWATQKTIRVGDQNIPIPETVQNLAQAKASVLSTEEQERFGFSVYEHFNTEVSPYNSFNIELRELAQSG